MFSFLQISSRTKDKSEKVRPSRKSVNNHDLRNLRHEEAVELLNTQKEQVELELLFVSPSDDLPNTLPVTKLNGLRKGL